MTIELPNCPHCNHSLNEVNYSCRQDGQLWFGEDPEWEDGDTDEYVYRCPFCEVEIPTHMVVEWLEQYRIARTKRFHLDDKKEEPPKTKTIFD
tara:strand:+ start:87 stop:365 length:279 start_codon:yes stop_codon:yes gene_type:complete